MTTSRTFGPAPSRRLAAVTALMVVTGLLQALPASAVAAKPRPLTPQAGHPVAGAPARPRPASIPTMPTTPARKPRWPAARASTVDLTARKVAAVGSGVSVTAGPKAAPGRVSVEVLDRAVAARAHHDVAVRVRRADGKTTPGQVAVKVDYTGFTDAYGADYASRLRLVSLPECALSTPEAPACAPTQLATTNDGKAVSAAVAVTGAGSSVVAVASAAAGASGDYGATSMASSAAWTAGSSSGAFTWSYPMRVPPSLGGPAPELSLDYSSQAVDGRTAVTNNQPSWAGEGFGYEPGFIERRYVTCSEDNDDKDRKGNNTAETSDHCWGTDNATLSLDGIGGGELIYNAGEKRWHTRSDDGVRIERFYGASNGDAGDTGTDPGAAGEHWVVTATNGTKYYFGLNRLPGYTAGAAQTNSVFTAPVAGNQGDEPCNKTAFKDSFCVQAWRWNLDWVVDPKGNAESFWYSQEGNKYGRNNTASDVQPYVRAGNVTRIDYGQTAASGYATAPMSVAFGTADRCQSACTDKANWQDAPLDQECTGSTCSQFGPTYFSKRRLATVTTRVFVPATARYRDVDRWTLTHTWPDPGDGTRRGMWLSKISHTGWDKNGVAATAPDVTLVGVPKDNRVDTALSNGLRPMRWYRMKTIYTETGGQIDVSYLPTDCTAGALPNPATNTRRCFPVRWAPPDLGGAPGREITDWFHKYVVESVRENDTKSPAEGYPLSTLTSYRYDAPAWRYTDDDGLTKDKYRTWSQWRGYGLVSVIKGEDGDRTRVDTRYFRGMDGDRKGTDVEDGTRSVSVTDSKNRATIADSDDLNGQVRETIVYDGPSGAAISGTISDPWLGTITATHRIDGVPANARYVDTAGVWSWTARDGGRPDTWTHSETDFDAYGMPVAVTDHGSTATSGDERCVLTDYARDDGAAWMIAFPYQVRTFALTCDEARRPGRVIAADEVIGATRNSFDGKAAGVAPTEGLTTATEAMEDWRDNRPVYFTATTAQFDAYGRTRFSWDAEQKMTETSYTPASGGPLVQVDAKNPLGWTSYTQIDPGTGATTLSSDANGRRTESSYDGLGRLVSVWLPGRGSAANDVPNVQHTYTLNTDRASVVRTDTLNASGKVTTSYAFFDSLLRPVQTQTPSATKGMLVSDTFYDTAGRPNVTYGPYWVDGRAASTSRWQPTMPAGRDNVLSWTKTVFDGAGRPTNAILFSKLTEKWRTTTVYGGDHADTIPPLGGTVESKYVDPIGRTTEIRQYRGREASGGYDSTKYTYNGKGQLATVTNPMRTVWEYGYDIQGRQSSVKDPDKGSFVSTFDRLGRLLKTTDGKNQVLAYSYDALGRKTGLFAGSTGGTKLAAWTYDGITGSRGMLTSSARYVDGDLANPYTSATLTLDAATGLPTKTAVTVPATEKGLAGTYTYQARYAVDGTPKTSLVPALGGLGAETLTNGFDDLGIPTTLSTTMGGDYVPSVQLTEFGEPSITVFANAGGKSVQIKNDYYEDTRRLASTQAYREINPAVVSWKTYKYDNAGNITRTGEESNVAGAETQCWRLDYLQRLSDAWTPKSGDCAAAPSVDGLADGTAAPAPYWTSWTFNAAGDRTRQVEHRTEVGERTTDYAYPAPTAAHPHAVTGTTVTGSAGTGATAGYTYDQSGNTTQRPTARNGPQTLTWDAEGHLATATDTSGTSSYVYDASGNRLISKDAAGKTLYLPGQELRVNNDGAVQSCTRYYSYGGKTVAQRTTAGLTWLVSDTQNTASISVDASTQQATVRHLSAYGEDRDGQSTWPNDKGFLGKTVDRTGLTHVDAREYDPAMGRFVSVDPLMDVADPQQMQGYSYANNNPVSFSDPDGRMIVNDGAGLFKGNSGSGSSSGGGSNAGGGSNGGGGVSNGGGNSGGGSGNGGGANRGGGHGNGHSSGNRQQSKCEHSWLCRAKKWGSDHKADIAGFAAGTVVGVGCGFAIGWSGVGAVACGAFAGAAGSIVHDMVEGGHSVEEMAGNAVFSGAIGGLTGGVMSIGGRALSAGVRTLVSGGGAQAARQATGGAARAEGKNIVSGLTRGLRRSCAHSFAAGTLVLMADGSTKRIDTVRDGDEVLSTDPEAGTTGPEKVADLHLNRDTDMTDLTVTVGDGQRSTLHTTQHHPFWSASRGEWVDAADLVPGEVLHAADGTTVTVSGVHSFTGVRTMRDLTVDRVHTYYVISGSMSILVHNCGGLNWSRAKVNDSGVNAVERHLSRFTDGGPLEPAEQGMLDRLRGISSGRIGATPHDLRFYTHELRESVLYRKAGYPSGQPESESYELWDLLHTQALKDYGLTRAGAPNDLYHPSVR